MLQIVLAIRHGSYQSEKDYNMDGFVRLDDISALGKALVDGKNTPLSVESLVLTRIDGASFIMGNDNGLDNEKPEHEVTVNPFKISKYEITNSQYATYLNEALELGHISVFVKGSAVADSGAYAGMELLFFKGARGGGWNSCEETVTTTARASQDKHDHRGPEIGFRVAGDIE